MQEDEAEANPSAEEPSSFHFHAHDDIMHNEHVPRCDYRDSLHCNSQAEMKKDALECELQIKDA